MENFEQKKNQKAFTYTLLICGSLLLLCFLVSWKVKPATAPLQADQIEVDLGNLEEGNGDRLPGNPNNPINTIGGMATKGGNEAPQKINTDPNSNTKTTLSNTTQPKYLLPSNQQNNQGPDQDGFNNNGTNGGGEGGDGIGNGGNGAGLGISVEGNKRKIIKYPSLIDQFKRNAVIYAMVKVSKEGKGIFVSIARGSSETGDEYKNAIIRQLANLSFNPSNKEDVIKVRFEFKVK